jgi:hypothetical protein
MRRGTRLQHNILSRKQGFIIRPPLQTTNKVFFILSTDTPTLT